MYVNRIKFRVRSPSLPPLGRKLGSCLLRQYFCAACNNQTHRVNHHLHHCDHSPRFPTSLPPCWIMFLTSLSVNLDMEMDLTRCANSRLPNNSRHSLRKQDSPVYKEHLQHSLDAAAGGADEGVEVQTHVLGHLQACQASVNTEHTIRSQAGRDAAHHLVAVEAALVGRVGALEVAQLLHQALFQALLAGR
jgi:hypothetical protein